MFYNHQMSTTISRPDKNQFLLYSMLIALKQLRGKVDSHHLRRKTTEHFQKYSGIGLQESEYIHHSKPVAFMLTLEEAPVFKPKKIGSQNEYVQYDIDKGNIILPHVKHFYQTTDFEDFYAEILPYYLAETDFIQQMMDNLGLDEFLNDLYQIDSPMDMVIIPMPLEAKRSGIGPYIDNTSYQIIGPSFDYEILWNIVHEASHPRAKEVFRDIEEKIESYKHLFPRLQENPRWSRNYNNWRTAFEEHFIRAMQATFINPRFDIQTTENTLQIDEQGQAMLYVRDIHEVLKKYIDRSFNIHSVIEESLEYLDKKYQ